MAEGRSTVTLSKVRARASSDSCTTRFSMMWPRVGSPTSALSK